MLRKWMLADEICSFRWWMCGARFRILTYTRTSQYMLCGDASLSPRRRRKRWNPRGCDGNVLGVRRLLQLLGTSVMTWMLGQVVGIF